MSKVLVTGAGAGLGAAIVDMLLPWHDIFRFDRKLGHDVRSPRSTYGMPPDGLDILINCAGVNITGWLDEFDEESWDEVLDINAKGIFMMSRWAYPELARTRGTILNIVSNASHMPMTTSLAYNASKGAAHIMTQQLARELTPKNGITVFGISPNKLAGTEMSTDIERQVVKHRGWTEEYAREYQRNALLTREETSPKAVAGLISYLLMNKDNHKYLSGCIIPYGC